MSLFRTARGRVTNAMCLLAVLATHCIDLAPPVFAQSWIFSSELSTEDLAERAANSVVKLEVHDNSGAVVGQGTGLIVNSGGSTSLIATNSHVVEDASRVVAISGQGESVNVACIVATDFVADLALLKIPRGKYSPLALTPSTEEVKIGSKIVVIGNPLGYQNTVSEGIVSSRRSQLPTHELLQITAPISPGSSGSPVLNREGKVVGVVTALVDGNHAQNLNFAVSANSLQRLIANNSNTCAPPVDLTYAKSDYDASQFDSCPLRNSTDPWGKEASHVGLFDALKAEAWASVYNISKYLNERCPNLYLHYIHRAAAAAKLERWERVPSLLAKGVSICQHYDKPRSGKLPSAASCWSRAGSKMSEYKIYGVAAECYGHALETEPEEVSHLLGLAAAVGKNGNADAAEGILQRALRIAERGSFDQDLIEASTQLAEFYHESGRIDEAWNTLTALNKRRTKFDSTDLRYAELKLHEGFSAIAHTLNQQGDVENEEKALRMALEFWDRCVALTKNAPDSQERRASSIAPNEEECFMMVGMGDTIRSRLASVLMRAGKIEEGKKLLMKWERSDQIPVSWAEEIRKEFGLPNK